MTTTAAESTPVHLAAATAAVRAALRERPGLGAAQAIAACMGAMNGFPELPGPEKKAVLLRALAEVATSAGKSDADAPPLLSQEMLETVRLLIDSNVVGGLIDALADVAAGRYGLAGAARASKACLPFFKVCVLT